MQSYCWNKSRAKKRLWFIVLVCIIYCYKQLCLNVLSKGQRATWCVHELLMHHVHLAYVTQVGFRPLTFHFPIPPPTQFLYLMTTFAPWDFLFLNPSWTRNSPVFLSTKGKMVFIESLVSNYLNFQNLCYLKSVT